MSIEGRLTCDYPDGRVFRGSNLSTWCAENDEDRVVVSSISHIVCVVRSYVEARHLTPSPGLSAGWESRKNERQTYGSRQNANDHTEGQVVVAKYPCQGAFSLDILIPTKIKMSPKP
jgi:hypothetical protein